MAALPMHLAAEVGGVRVAIVHGDLESLAGWSLSQSSLASDNNITLIYNQILTSMCRIVASSHTYLPVARRFDTSASAYAVFINGAAGMPNFRDSQFGVITRIAKTPTRVTEPLYSMRIDELYVDALPIAYDFVRWQRRFLAQWPPRSPAYVSYYRRIVRGPEYSGQEANRLAVSDESAAQTIPVAQPLTKDIP